MESRAPIVSIGLSNPSSMHYISLSRDSPDTFFSYGLALFSFNKKFKISSPFFFAKDNSKLLIVFPQRYTLMVAGSRRSAFSVKGIFDRKRSSNADTVDSR